MPACAGRWRAVEAFPRPRPTQTALVASQGRAALPQGGSACDTRTLLTIDRTREYMGARATADGHPGFHILRKALPQYFCSINTDFASARAARRGPRGIENLQNRVGAVGCGIPEEASGHVGMSDTLTIRRVLVFLYFVCVPVDVTGLRRLSGGVRCDVELQCVALWGVVVWCRRCFFYARALVKSVYLCCVRCGGKLQRRGSGDKTKKCRGGEGGEQVGSFRLLWENVEMFRLV
ncbi:unnamed protein product, partial [Scytosiphon promiscuus]